MDEEADYLMSVIAARCGDAVADALVPAELFDEMMQVVLDIEDVCTSYKRADSVEAAGRGKHRNRSENRCSTTIGP